VVTGGTSISKRRLARRAALLDAAVACVRADGPFLTMEQLADGCGVTKPILYRHFGDKDGLVEAMAERFIDALVRALQPAMSSRAPLDRLLLDTMDAYLSLVESDTSLYLFLSTQAGATKRDVLASLIAEEVALLLERRATEALDVAGARIAAYGLVGMVQFAGDWWVSQPAAARVDRAALVGQLSGLAWRGLAATTGDGGHNDPDLTHTTVATSQTDPADQEQ